MLALHLFDHGNIIELLTDHDAHALCGVQLEKVVNFFTPVPWQGHYRNGTQPVKGEEKIIKLYNVGHLQDEEILVRHGYHALHSFMDAQAG